MYSWTRFEEENTLSFLKMAFIFMDKGLATISYLCHLERGRNGRKHNANLYEKVFDYFYPV